MAKCQHMNLKCQNLMTIDKNSKMNDQVSTPELEVSTLGDSKQKF